MALEARGIGLNRGGNTILHGVSFIARPGEFVSLIGPNGAGKSTLFACLAGEAKSQSGQVAFKGSLIANVGLQSLAQQRAVMWQDASAAAGLSVYDLVALGRVPHGDAAARIGQVAIAEALNTVDLTHLVERRFETLSGGERQRVDFARALCQLHGVQQPLLMLDEPIASLDLKYQYLVMQAARRFVDAGGCCVCVCWLTGQLLVWQIYWF